MKKPYKVYFKRGSKRILIEEFETKERASTFMGIESTQMEAESGTFFLIKDGKTLERLKVR